MVPKLHLRYEPLSSLLFFGDPPLLIPQVGLKEQRTL